MDILDNEASEDESARKRTHLNRAPSHEANLELIEKEKRYRSILQQAAASDETVRQKWDDWEDNIVELTQDEVRQGLPSVYHHTDLFFYSSRISKHLFRHQRSLPQINRHLKEGRLGNMHVLCAFSWND